MMALQGKNYRMCCSICLSVQKPKGKKSNKEVITWFMLILNPGTRDEVKDFSFPVKLHPWFIAQIPEQGFTFLHLYPLWKEFHLKMNSSLLQNGILGVSPSTLHSIPPIFLWYSILAIPSASCLLQGLLSACILCLFWILQGEVTYKDPQPAPDLWLGIFWEIRSMESLFCLQICQVWSSANPIAFIFHLCFTFS